MNGKKNLGTKSSKSSKVQYRVKLPAAAEKKYAPKADPSSKGKEFLYIDYQVLARYAYRGSGEISN
jgi:hypothetical protein